MTPRWKTYLRVLAFPALALALSACGDADPGDAGASRSASLSDRNAASSPASGLPELGAPVILKFPKKKSIGKLGVRDADSTTFEIGEVWESYGEARGAIPIPEGKLVNLTVSWTLKNFSVLKNLGPDGIDSLVLSQPNITNAALTSIRAMTGLRQLSLEGSHITDAGLIHLRNLTSLITLRLAGTEITDKGLTHLKGLASLRHLSLDDTRITQTGLDRLRIALPDCRITHSLDEQRPFRRKKDDKPVS